MAAGSPKLHENIARMLVDEAAPAVQADGSAEVAHALAAVRGVCVCVCVCVCVHPTPSACMAR
jgi:hypothetical protein